MKAQSNKDRSLRVLKKFRVIYGTVRQHFREVERTCGITGAQLWVIREIETTPGIGVSELADRLSIHQSTCSQLVEKLAVRGMVRKERSSEDQRRVGLHLTGEAAALVKQAPGPVEGVLPEALSALSSQEIQALDAALESLIRQLQIHDERYAERPLSDL